MKPDVLPIKTVCNPRDLGGYVGFEGRKVKAHRLLRTGKISNISEHDRQFLCNYGLCKIIDLRSPLEIKMAPDQEIPGVEHFNISISDEDNTQGGKRDLKKVFEIYNQDQYAGFKMMCERYKSHVTKPHALKSLREILEIFANTEDGAVLYHCSEGKDRTGLVTVVMLYILGVDFETIRQDYLYSNYMLNNYRAIRDRRFKEDGKNLKFRANMRTLGSVSDAFIDTSLIVINERYGGLDNFIESGIHVGPELRDTLRDLYLEKD